MKSSAADRSVTFDSEQRIYGAFAPDTQLLLLLVEATDDAKARVNVGLVAPYLGIVGASELLVVELTEMPSGVPTFLCAFFAAGKISVKRENVAPGTSTLQ